MILRPLSSTRTYPLFPYATRFRARRRVDVRRVLYVVERQGEDVPEPLQARHRSGRRPEVILAPVGDREFVPRPFVEYAPYAHLPFAGFLVTDHRPRPPHILGLLGAVGRVPLRLDVVIVDFLHLVREIGRANV